MEDTITAGQVKVIHTLLNKNNELQFKEVFISMYTDNRTTSCKGMNFKEAKALIVALRNAKVIIAMRCQVLECAKILGLAYGNSTDDYHMNIAKIDEFLLLRGTVKKEFTFLKYSELKKVVTQFKAMVKSKDQSNWNKYLKSTLKELEIG